MAVGPMESVFHERTAVGAVGTSAAVAAKEGVGCTFFPEAAREGADGFADGTRSEMEEVMGAGP